jgi:hypothetical protein
MWLVATIGIVVVGALLIAFSRADRHDASAVSPQIGEHFHAYLGVNICGEWISNAPEFHQRAGESRLNAGIHSHGDGLIHLHPFSSDEAGEKATVGRFMDYGGWSVSSDEIEAWDGTTHRNGQECTGATPGKGKVQWKVGRHNEPWPTKARTGNPADYHPKNGDIVAIYFVPEGAPLDEPPAANSSLDSIEDLGGQPATPQAPASSTPPGSDAAPDPTATTAPASPPSSTP